MTDVKDYPPYLDYPKERKKQTNADKYFRNATDEELAEWMLKFAEQIAKQATDNYVMEDSFAKDALDWLKQEVESDG